MSVSLGAVLISDVCLSVLCMQLMSAVGETEAEVKPPADSLVVRNIIMLML